MSFGACTELSGCFARTSIRPTSHQYSGSQCSIGPISDRRIGEVGSRRIDKYNSVLSISRDTGVARAVSNSSSQGLTYKDAGVDIDAGSELVRRIAKMAPGIGGFGGFFPLGMLYFDSNVTSCLL